jgi:hypothetical protein
LLRQKCISQVRHPLNIVGHARNDVRISYQSLDAWVPRLLRHSVCQGFVIQTLVLLHPLLKLHDFERISGSSERLSQKWIRIKSDRRDQRIQLTGRELGSLIRV